MIKEIGDPKRYAEIVFCGYGEPLLRLDVVKAVAAEVKRRGGNVRIDTNGHGNLIYKRNILPELAGLVDAVSVSLNAQNAEIYDRISQPKFGIETYEAVKDFIREANKIHPRCDCHGRVRAGGRCRSLPEDRGGTGRQSSACGNTMSWDRAQHIARFFRLMSVPAY